MPKPLELSDEAFTAPPIPRAAHVTAQEPPPAKPVRTGESRRKKKPSGKAASAERDEKHVPLQLRWPRSEVKAAKLAAVQGDYDSVSEFMLACLHAYMQ